MAQPEFYTGQDARIDFACLDENGAPLDLTTGRVEATLERRGIKPYYLQVDTDNIDLVQWKQRDQGTGILTIPIFDQDVPVGTIKFMLRSILESGKADIQYLSWAKVIRTPSTT